MTMDTSVSQEERRAAYQLLVLVYTHLWSQYGEPVDMVDKPQFHARSFRATSEQQLQDRLISILQKIGQARQDKEMARMTLARLRNKKHPLAQNDVPLLAVDSDGSRGRIILLNYDPSALSIEVALTRQAEPESPPEGAPAKALRPFSWTKRKLAWLYNVMAQKQTVGGTLLLTLKDPLRSFARKWDTKSGQLDVQDGLNQLLAEGRADLIATEPPTLVLRASLDTMTSALCPDTTSAAAEEELDQGQAGGAAKERAQESPPTPPQSQGRTRSLRGAHPAGSRIHAPPAKARSSGRNHSSMYRESLGCSLYPRAAVPAQQQHDPRGAG